MKIVLVCIAIFFIGISIALPASAQIVPACGENGVGPCTICDFWQLGNNIINFLLWELALPVLTVVLLWGGTVWATSGGSPGQITRGKQIMTTGLVGILIAVSAWLVVDTIIKTLAADGEFKAAWNEFPTCEPPIKTEPVVVTPAPPSGTTTAPQIADAEARESVIRAQLQAAGIPVNKNPCNPYNSRYQDNPGGCTNVGGLPDNIVPKLIQVQAGWPIRISGGSEEGHQTHGNGMAIVDITPNPVPASTQRWCDIYEAVRQTGPSFWQYERAGTAGTRITCFDNPDHLHVCFNEPCRR
ncbi:hypothetical protein A3J56_03360 [Candidatus Giovannonibacteria bacterium RIFCSPHIGHO2_02_FULL_46_20]|uniref:Peptidase M15A C-terminal domain-containing protein n=1 Tax=Candidatus Giovannonibacteria bacterium RIFCSPHIGHO2_02_FULL_46_20 TaxID=1798338 RepID=A0A1F5WG30_9BACT|nr:MAG: hypothetical protein A3J56_03360 [Candidatus Giovannonibacteria bacterium RIFCSPHIGHO2_02_FULL_46_20]